MTFLIDYAVDTLDPLSSQAPQKTGWSCVVQKRWLGTYMSMYGSFVYLFVCLFSLILSSYCGISMARPVVKRLELQSDISSRWFEFNCSKMYIKQVNWKVFGLRTMTAFYWAYIKFSTHNLIVLIWTFQTLVIKKFLPGKKEKIKLVITLRQKDYANIDKSRFEVTFWRADKTAT